jgi:hypothetical protein
MTTAPILRSNVCFAGNEQLANFDVITAGRHVKRRPIMAAKV